MVLDGIVGSPSGTCLRETCSGTKYCSRCNSPNPGKKTRIETDVIVNWTLQSAFVIRTVSMNLRIYRKEYYGMKLKEKQNRNLLNVTKLTPGVN